MTSRTSRVRRPIPGLVLYRFTASLIFYNAPHFRRRVLAVADAHPGAKWLIVDGSSIVHLDSTGADTLVTLAEDLRAGNGWGSRPSYPQVQRMLESSGALERLGPDAVMRSLRAAVETLRSERRRKEAYVSFQSLCARSPCVCRS